MPRTDATRLRFLADRSVSVILANQAPSGAYLASPEFPVYRYSWFRDGSFIADAMSRAGHPASAERFFGWCARVLADRSAVVESLLARRLAGETIPPSDFLHTRYTVDGEDSAEDWWTFQLDGYGTWLWALGEHARRHGTSVAPYADAIALSVRYLAALWSDPCYDWWEEHVEERHTSTLGALFAGLDAAARFEDLSPDVRAAATEAATEIRAATAARAIHQGRLTKWLDGTDLDASLVACATPFGLVEPGGPVAAATVAALEQELAHDGVHRYAGDVYYGGGEWLLLAGLLGWHYAQVGRTEDAWRELRWIAAQSTADGHLAEQVSDHLLHPDSYAGWVARWGPVATPLLWSHAMYLTLALALGAASAPVGPEPTRGHGMIAG